MKLEIEQIDNGWFIHCYYALENQHRYFSNAKEMMDWIVDYLKSAFTSDYLGFVDVKFTEGLKVLSLRPEGWKK
jgi:hypothetical protein